MLQFQEKLLRCRANQPPLRCKPPVFTGVVTSSALIVNVRLKSAVSGHTRQPTHVAAHMRVASESLGTSQAPAESTSSSSTPRASAGGDLSAIFRWKYKRSCDSNTVTDTVTIRVNGLLIHVEPHASPLCTRYAFSSIRRPGAFLSATRRSIAPCRTLRCPARIPHKL
jgi:hypothetical protein